MTAIQKTVLIVLACVSVVVGLTVHKVLNNQGQANPAALLDAGIVMLQSPRVLPAIPLLNQDGQEQPLDQLKGKWTLVFFGYTFCPDICPTTLAEMRHIKAQLPADVQQQLQVVMISVDPARDSAQQLKQYLGFFDPQFIGLTGPLTQIQQAANALGVPFIPGDESRENYTVDHGGNLALLDPAGQQRGFIRAPLRADKLIEQLPKVLAQP